MARKVFFSFHYERDSQRAAQVRNADMLADEDEYGVIDAVEWEKLERAGAEAIKRWILSQMEGTSATVVLIGAETSERPWVIYEIEESWKRGNGIVGVRIHNVKNLQSQTDLRGANPFDKIRFSDGTQLSSVAKTYDWVSDSGRDNLGIWVEEAIGKRAVLTEKKIQSEGVKGLLSTTPRSQLASSGLISIKNPPGPWAF